MERVALVVDLEHDAHRPSDELLLVGLHPQRHPDQLRQRDHQGRPRPLGRPPPHPLREVGSPRGRDSRPTPGGRGRRPTSSRRSRRSLCDRLETPAPAAATGAALGSASATASSSCPTSTAAAVGSRSSYARACASWATLSRSRWSSPSIRQLGRSAPTAGASLPAATKRPASSAAPPSRATLGCTSPCTRARLSTGNAARMGSAIVRFSSVNSIVPSRGGSAGRKVAGPVTGTKLTQPPSRGRVSRCQDLQVAMHPRQPMAS